MACLLYSKEPDFDLGATGYSCILCRGTHQCARGRRRCEQGAVRRTMGPSKEHCERRDDDGKGKTRRRQEDVELNDVDDHRREDDDPERHHAEQQQRSADQLRGEERREHEAARRQAAEERDGRLWHLGLRKELKEAIQPEHDEDDPEQDSRDQHSSLHWISSLAPRLRGGMAPRRPAASSIACRISARLFMTNGPYCTIGSRSGAPAIRRTRDGSAARSTTPSAAGSVVRIPIRPRATETAGSPTPTTPSWT